MSAPEDAAGCVAAGCMVPVASMFSIWGVIFIIIKTMGTALATWSWWWILFPIVPSLYAILRALGLVS